MKKLLTLILLLACSAKAGISTGPNAGTSGGTVNNTTIVSGTNAASAEAALFFGKAKILDPFARDAINNFVTELQQSGYYGNLVDAMFFHPRFNPTNKVSFFGNTWTTINPQYTDWGAGFYGTNAITLNLSSAISNYTIVVVQSMENQLPLSTINGLPNTGYFLYSLQNVNSNGNFTAFDSFFGLRVYEFNGNTNWPYRIDSNLNNQADLNRVKHLGSLNTLDPNMWYRGVFAESRDTAGKKQVWVDTIPAYIGGSAIYTSPVICANTMTVLNLGTNDAWTTIADAGNPTYNTNYFGEISCVLLFNIAATNTSGTNLINSSYRAESYLEPFTRDFFCWGDSIMADRQVDALSNTASYTNSIFYRWRLRYPYDRKFHQYAQGGATVAGLVTNATSGAMFPSSPVVYLPVGTEVKILTDIGRNDSSVASNAATMTKDFNRFFGPIKLATGARVIGVETMDPWTNATAAGQFSNAGSNNLSLWNTYMRSNPVINQTIPMWLYVDQVTEDTNKNNAITFDGIHIQGYGSGWKINDQIAGLIEGTPWPYAQQQGSSGFQQFMQTNWVNGARYTNDSGAPWLVTYDFNTTVAGVAGGSWAGITFSPDGATFTTKSNGIATSIATVGSGPYGVASMVIPSRWVFAFTNVSAGIGNTITFSGGTYTRIGSTQ